MTRGLRDRGRRVQGSGPFYRGPVKVSGGPRSPERERPCRPGQQQPCPGLPHAWCARRPGGVRFGWRWSRVRCFCSACCAVSRRGRRTARRSPEGLCGGTRGASRPCPCWTASRRQGTGLRPGSRWGVRVASRTCGAPGPTPGPADSPRLGRARGLRRCGWRLRVVSRVRSWRRGPVRSLWLGLAPGLRRGAWWRSASASWLSRVPGLRSPRAGRLVVSGRCPARARGLAPSPVRGQGRSRACCLSARRCAERTSAWCSPP
ncbi:hypothetical protein RKD39_002690 [Streptomyces albogriseolus]